MKYGFEVIFTYLFIINLINFVLFYLDKKRAKDRQWRIPELTLFLVSVLGGTMGGLIGMQFFKHKTKKLKFTIGMPLLLIINILVIRYVLTI